MSGRATFYDQPFLSYGNFLESIVLFLAKLNTQIEDFEKLCVTREGFSASAKYKKIQLRVQWLQRISNKR